jgi:hypothetical protein
VAYAEAIARVLSGMYCVAGRRYVPTAGVTGR